MQVPATMTPPVIAFISCLLTGLGLHAATAVAVPTTATLTVSNATTTTLTARYKDRDHPWSTYTLHPGDSHDFTHNDYFSVTVYDPNQLTHAITSEQFTTSLGFRPERTGPHSYCNDYSCLFDQVDAAHATLTIDAR